MLRGLLLLGLLVWTGCGNEVRTYRVAPYLTPGSTCVMCPFSMALWAQEEGESPPRDLYLAPEQLAEEGFTFRWGTEQLIEIEVERYDGDVRADDPGVLYIFRRVVESREVEPGARFEMPFPPSPPASYPEGFLEREGDGFRLGPTVRLTCVSAEVCEQLAARRLGEAAFVLELSYPETEGAPLRLHAVR